MGEYIGCGRHGVTRVLGYEDENKVLVMGCGDRIPVAELLVPIFEAPDEGENAPVITHPEPAAADVGMSVPVADAIAAAEEDPDATWTEVVAKT